LEREERFSDETAARNGSGTLGQRLGIMLVLRWGNLTTLETYPLGLRHIANARIEDWAHAVSFEIEPPLARTRAFIEALERFIAGIGAHHLEDHEPGE
jgi:hypothetical protein